MKLKLNSQEIRAAINYLDFLSNSLIYEKGKEKTKPLRIAEINTEIFILAMVEDKLTAKLIKEKYYDKKKKFSLTLKVWEAFTLLKYSNSYTHSTHKDLYIESVLELNIQPLWQKLLK